MSPRERILATIDRRPTDRTPIDLWLTPEVLQSLRDHTGERDELSVYHQLGLDKIVWVFPGYGSGRFDPNEGQGQTMWGVPTRMIKAGAATYQEFGTPPLGDYEDIARLDDYPLWPDPANFDYAGAKEWARKARSFNFATIGPWISHFEIYCQMRGLENSLMDIAADPEFLDATLDRIDAIQTAMIERFLGEMGDLIDIVFISDDMGTQESLLISPAAWERHFRDRLKNWCDLIHRHGKKVLYHTDGAVRPLLPGIIKCGIDILNPIQHICPGMDRDALQRDFGGQVIFHGGVDNQKVLPFGSADDVRDETRTCIETLGRAGGFICCSCHNVQAGTPVENILAMIEEVQKPAKHSGTGVINQFMKKSFLFLAVATGLMFAVPGFASPARLLEGGSPIEEPYKPLHGGSFSGGTVPLSPDPLVTYRWKETKPNDELQTYLLAPVKVTTDQPNSFGNLESVKGPNCNVHVKGPGSIQFDFGVESAAWLEFDSPDLTGDVKLSISEYNEPSIMSGPGTAIKTKTPVKHGNTYRLELNRDLYEGVRFGWIHVNKFDKPFRITAVRLVCQIKPVNYEGRFSCSDPLLTAIWYVGAYGVKLNMLHNNLGAILMDRGDRISWTGDNYPAHAAIMTAFADYPFVKTSLDRTATNDNDIASYSLYWVLSLMDYYRYSGDAAALREHAANAKAKLEHANQIYANPKLTFFGWDERLGAGFQEAEIPIEPKDAFRMIFIRACREYAEGMRTIGNTHEADTFDKMADQRIAELRAEGKWEDRFGLHAAADAVNAGFTSPDEQARLFDREFSNRATRVSFSSFNQYFVIQAMARMNRYDEALASIRDHWGGQIEYGGTCFFEVFWPAWTPILGRNDTIPNSQAGKTSLCHPWGSGVTKWLTEEVLGVKPTAPGFTTYDIFPHLGRTLTEVSGDVPTPKGDIHASFDVSKGVASVRAPEGTSGRIGIPTAEKTIESILINGKLAWDGTFHTVTGVGGASVNRDFVIFRDVQPGSYEIKVAYSGATPVFTDVPWQFPTTFVKEDRTTGGGWGEKYGKDGSVLFGADGPDKDYIKLPSYVASVTRRWGRVGPFPVAPDSRALAKDSKNDQPRSNGVFYTGQRGLQQCLVLDIALKQPTDYQLALYFVDLDRKGRRQSLELLDLVARKLIAPTRIYADFEGGMYAVYNCDRSVRLRVNQIRGDNAVLSGIFFDPPGK